MVGITGFGVRAALTAISLCACLTSTWATPIEKRQSEYDWEQAPSSPKLQFQSCYGDAFQCSRLEVPLDYSKPVKGDIFKLAVLRLPSKPTVPYQGQIWMFQPLEGNVDFVLGLGPILQDFGGLEGYDLMTFDYRGSRNSRPKIQCFQSQALQDQFAERLLLGTRLGEFNRTYPPTVHNIRNNINEVGSLMKKFGDGCNKYFGKYIPYMGSPDAARDLHFVLSQFKSPKMTALRFNSYATVFGTTYAAMYPNGFDVMILDGQTDTAKVYARGDNDPTSISDAAVAEQIFYDSCAAAQPCNATQPSGTCQGCYFWAPTAKEVKARYQAVKAKYYAKPFKSNPPSSVCGDCTTTHFEISTILSNAMLVPFTLDWFTLMSQRLVELELGTALPGGGIESFSIFQDPHQVFSPFQQAVRCFDQGNAIRGTDAFAAYLKQMNSTSCQMGPLVAAQELQCANWPATLKPKHPFSSGWSKIKTKGQMLFLSNVADPIQSYANTEAMAARFTKSTILVSNAVGSSSVFNGFSPCQQTYIQSLLAQNTPPPNKAFCNDFAPTPFNVPYQKDYRNQREKP